MHEDREGLSDRYDSNYEKLMVVIQNIYFSNGYIFDSPL